MQIVFHVCKFGRGEGREPVPGEGVSEHSLDAQPAGLLLPTSLLPLQLLDALQSQVAGLVSYFVSFLKTCNKFDTERGPERFTYFER